MMMVTRANKRFDGLGGHISTYASIATLWEVGLNHVFRGKDGVGMGTMCTGKGMRTRDCTLEHGWRDDSMRHASNASEGEAFGRPVLLSSSTTDAGLLGVPDREHGPRRDDCDSTRSVQPIPPGPWPRRYGFKPPGTSWVTASPMNQNPSPS